MQRLLCLLLCILLGGLMVFSQESMTVESFNEIENDLDALENYSKIDQNGTKCALIKVTTTVNKLSFEVGSLGIVDCEQKSEKAEWWVYVPEKVMKLKITHPIFGQLNTEDGFYYFKSPLKAATVYRLVLRTPQMDELEQSNDFGFLNIESKPDGAQVSIQHHGEEIYKGTAPIQEYLHYGTYTCVVSMPGYVSESVQAILNKKEVLLEVSLRESLYDSLSDSISEKVVVMSDPNHANVTIDGKSSGKTPQDYKLVFGEHKITLSTPGYNTLDTTITVIRGIPQTLRLSLIPLQEEARPSVETQYTDEEFEKFRAELEAKENEKYRIEFEERKRKEAQELAEAQRRAQEEQAKAQRRIEEAQRKAERLKLLSTPIQSRFESIVQVGYTGVPVQIKGVSEYFGMTMLGINYIAGWRFNNTLFLGAGIGGSFDFSDHDDCIYFRPAMQTEEQTYVDGSPWQFPLFAHMRAYLTGGKPVQFFFSLSAGYIFEPDSRVIIYHNNIPESQYSNYNGSSFFVAPGLGINIRLSSKVGFDISASYQGRWQKAVYYYPDNMYENKWLSGVNINWGLTF